MASAVRPVSAISRIELYHDAFSRSGSASSWKKRHRAGSAIALVAAFLGAARFFLEPQIVEHRLHRRYVAKFNDPPTAQKTDAVPYGHTLAPAIGGIAVGRKQQRHMIVLPGLCDAEADGNDIEEGG